MKQSDDLIDWNDKFTIKIYMKRQTSFYLFKVVLPLILITFLNFMGFSLDTLGDRLSHNVTLFLSAMALLYTVAQDLPRTTFLTAMIVEFTQLSIRCFIDCDRFKKNLYKDNVFYDDLGVFIVAIKEDPFHNIPGDLVVDPFKIVLMKMGDPRALLLPILKPNRPTKLLLSQKRALVISTRSFSKGGGEVRYDTVGPASRAMEVILDMDCSSKVILLFFLFF